MEYSIRPASSSDEKYILDSFSRAYCKSPYAEGIPRLSLACRMAEMLHNGWSCDVADLEGEVLGYVVYKRDINAVAWVCVKGPVQGKGIGEYLLRGACDREQPVKQPWLYAKNVAFAPVGYTFQWRPYLTWL